MDDILQKIAYIEHAVLVELEKAHLYCSTINASHMNAHCVVQKVSNDYIGIIDNRKVVGVET